MPWLKMREGGRRALIWDLGLGISDLEMIGRKGKAESGIRKSEFGSGNAECGNGAEGREKNVEVGRRNSEYYLFNKMIDILNFRHFRQFRHFRHFHYERKI